MTATMQLKVIPEHLAVKNNPPNKALYCIGVKSLIKIAAKVFYQEAIAPSKNLPRIITG